MRRAHFSVAGRFDGSDRATVTVEWHAPTVGFFRVRPLRRRRAFELSLADVARAVVYDVVKHELAAKKRAKGARR